MSTCLVRQAPSRIRARVSVLDVNGGAGDIAIATWWEVSIPKPQIRPLPPRLAVLYTLNTRLFDRTDGPRSIIGQMARKCLSLELLKPPADKKKSIWVHVRFPASTVLRRLSIPECCLQEHDGRPVKGTDSRASRFCLKKQRDLMFTACRVL